MLVKHFSASHGLLQSNLFSLEWIHSLGKEQSFQIFFFIGKLYISKVQILFTSMFPVILLLFSHPCLSDFSSKILVDVPRTQFYLKDFLNKFKSYQIVSEETFLVLPLRPERLTFFFFFFPTQKISLLTMLTNLIEILQILKFL